MIVWFFVYKVYTSCLHSCKFIPLLSLAYEDPLFSKKNIILKQDGGIPNLFENHLYYYKYSICWVSQEEIFIYHFFFILKIIFSLKGVSTEILLRVRIENSRWNAMVSFGAIQIPTRKVTSIEANYTFIKLTNVWLPVSLIDSPFGVVSDHKVLLSKSSAFMVVRGTLEKFICSVFH